VLGAFFTDMVAICEEQTASGVYLSGDPFQGGNLFGEDLAKFGIIITIIILAIAGAAGIAY
jgi:hypothetical protein